MTQIPALIIAVASGMIVTRSAAGNAFDVEIRTQVFGKPKTLMIAAGALLLFAIVPGLPAVPFLILGDSRDRSDICASARTSSTPATPEAAVALPAKEDKIEDYLQVDPLELEIGYGLISLVDEATGRRPVRAHHQHEETAGGGPRHDHPAGQGARQSPAGIEPLRHQDPGEPRRAAESCCWTGTWR